MWESWLLLDVISIAYPIIRYVEKDGCFYGARSSFSWAEDCIIVFGINAILAAELWSA